MTLRPWLPPPLRSWLVALALAVLVACVHGPPTLSPRASAQLEVFDEVWTTVRDTGFAVERSGLDWEQVRETYRPRAAEADGTDALYEVLEEMLGLLHLSHFAVMAPTQQVEIEALKAPVADPSASLSAGDGSSATGQAGLDVRWIQDRLIVIRAPEGSVVSPGDALIQIGTWRPDAEVGASAARNQRPSETGIRVRAQALEALSGPIGGHVAVEVEDPQGHRRSASLPLHAGEGKPTGLGHLSVSGEVEVRTLPGGVGYLRWNIFMMDLMEDIVRGLNLFKDSPGLILDLRGNPGGIAGMAQAVAGHIVTRPIHLGSMQHPDFTLEFPVNPRTRSFGGPLVVLIDATSASTSEILAVGLKEAGRATLVGETTAGLLLPSMVVKLSDGGLFQYALALYRSPSGGVVEGSGVAPDVEVIPDRKAWAGGHDLALDTAMEYLRLHRDAAGRTE